MSAPRKIPNRLQDQVRNLDTKHAGGSFALESFCTQLAINDKLLDRLLADEYFLNFIENNPNPDLFETSLSHLFYQLDKSLITYENVMKIILIAQLSKEARKVDSNIELNFEYKQNSHFALRAPSQPPLTDTPENKKKLNDALDIQWKAIRNAIPTLPENIPGNTHVLAMLNEHNPPKRPSSHKDEIKRHQVHSSTEAIHNGIHNVRSYQSYQPPVKAEAIKREDVVEEPKVSNTPIREEQEIFTYKNIPENKSKAGFIYKYDDNNNLIRSNVRHMTPATEHGPAHSAYVTSTGKLKSGGYFSSGAESIFIWNKNLEKVAEINIPKNKVIMSVVELDNGWLACCDRIGRLFVVDPTKPNKVYEYDDGEPKFIEGENRLTKLRIENGKLIQSSNTRSKEFDINTIMTNKKVREDYHEKAESHYEEKPNRYRK